MRFWSCGGESRRGGVAVVTELGHVADRLWMFFAVRHVGSYNFTDRLEHYELEFGPRDPDDPAEGDWTWPVFGADDRLAGYATIRAGSEDV